MAIIPRPPSRYEFYKMGLISLNQLREMEDLPPIKNREVLIPMNYDGTPGKIIGSDQIQWIPQLNSRPPVKVKKLHRSGKVEDDSFLMQFFIFVSILTLLTGAIFLCGK